MTALFFRYQSSSLRFSSFVKGYLEVASVEPLDLVYIYIYILLAEVNIENYPFSIIISKKLPPAMKDFDSNPISVPAFLITTIPDDYQQCTAL